MKLIWRLRSLNKHNHWLLKLAVAIMLMGIAFRLFFNQSTRFEPNLDTPFVDKATAVPKSLDDIPKPTPFAVNISMANPPAAVDVQNPPLSVDEPESQDQRTQEGN